MAAGGLPCGEDVLRIMSSMFQKSTRAKTFEFPSAVYAMHPDDRVLVDGKMAGLSTWIGYSANEGRMLTLAMVDAAYAGRRNKSHAAVGRGGRRHVETDD